MAELHDRGLVRNVGVSNFSRYQLSAALHVSDVPIAVNQIEYHPWYQRPELVNFCRDHDVVIEAAAPLARTDVLSDPTVQELAEQYNRSPAQIVLRWAIENDIVVIPRSRSREHIEENFDLFDFSLNEHDHQRLTDLDRDEPVYDDRIPSWEDDVWGIAR
jgi:diketogulonate reductase-like aldo/keto reductase